MFFFVKLNESIQTYLVFCVMKVMLGYDSSIKYYVLI